RAKQGDDGPVDDDPETHGPLMQAIIGRYEAVLSFALDHRSIVVLAIAVVLAGSYLLYYVLDYIAPPGSSLAETDRMLQHVEEMLLKTPEVESYSRRTGLEMGLFVTE